jgi:hypothetical protein
LDAFLVLYHPCAISKKLHKAARQPIRPPSNPFICLGAIRITASAYREIWMGLYQMNAYTTELILGLSVMVAFFICAAGRKEK